MTIVTSTNRLRIGDLVRPHGSDEEFNEVRLVVGDYVLQNEGVTAGRCSVWEVQR